MSKMIRRVWVFANATDTQDEFSSARARRFSAVVSISVSKRPSVFLAAARTPLCAAAYHRPHCRVTRKAIRIVPIAVR
jgi:hypothetical protein